MRDIYKDDLMNAPRAGRDVHFFDSSAERRYGGFIHRTYEFIENFQLIRPEVWARFVNQFREEDADFEGGWRGEYWGKCMRGAAFVYSYTKNSELYAVLKRSVIDMIASARENEGGRISSYATSHEFSGWDMWSRKYVLLGMQYFYEICHEEELRGRIVESMKTQADYIISHIGASEEGKKRIVHATNNWRGLNSSSILEPIVRLYSLTGEKRYFDFAEYIVSEGGCEVANVFELAYENGLKPYQYPVTKAYELTSCFEGLLEFYRVTGIEKYRTALINYADAVLESDFTVIGCCGCTHELFDHSTVRQANTTNEFIMQETCVTVTLMKFFYQIHLLTGDPKYIDAFEISLYNAYLGAINTEKVIEPTMISDHPGLNYEPLPFDSYSPLTAGRRGILIGGFKVMSDKHYYGCCACIGSLGIGLVSKAETLFGSDSLIFNLFISGKSELKTPAGNPITVITETDYPRSGRVSFTLKSEKPETFKIMIRNPAWSKKTDVTVNGEKLNAAEGYIEILREWKSTDEICVDFDMRTRAIRPIAYGTDVLMNKVVWEADQCVPAFDREDPMAHRHIAFQRGPIMLAEENRLGYSVDDPIDPEIDEDGYADFSLTEGKSPYESVVEGELNLKGGKKLLVTDYGSAGKLWNDESRMAVWMLT